MTYTEPLLTIFLAVAFAGWFRRRERDGAALVLVGLSGLFLLTWPPADWVFSRPLQRWYPVRPVRSLDVQAIVVFSSAVSGPVWERPYPLPDEETYRRCRYAAWLYGHVRAVPVVASGGGARGVPPFAWTMRSLLEEAGVPSSAIRVDDQSHSTHENAVFTARILREHGIRSVALVVDANSMPRAAASLRKAGISVVPAPSEFRQFGRLGEELLPSWKAVRRNEATLHEIGGLAWYWLRGWI